MPTVKTMTRLATLLILNRCLGGLSGSAEGASQTTAKASKLTVTRAAPGPRRCKHPGAPARDAETRVPFCLAIAPEKSFDGKFRSEQSAAVFVDPPLSTQATAGLPPCRYMIAETLIVHNVGSRAPQPPR